LWEPLAAKHAPPNGYAAKFSLPYLLAAILVKGRVELAEFTDVAVRDREILQVAERVIYEVDAAIDYPRQFIGDVEITLCDGRVLRARQDRPRGGPDAPMPRDELEAKFCGNATLAVSAAQAERVIRAVNGLATGGALADVVAALTS
jgi:2-methylcitrate dehydratase PrpD